MRSTANFSYGGATDKLTGRTHSVASLPFRQGPGTIVVAPVYWLPGTYTPTVALSFVGPGNVTICPPQPQLDLTSRPAGQPPAVDVATCLECPLRTDVAKTQITATPPQWRFVATVDWGPTPPPAPPLVTYYAWTIVAPNGTDTATATVRAAMPGAAAPNTITTQANQGWTGEIPGRARRPVPGTVDRNHQVRSVPLK